MLNLYVPVHVANSCVQHTFYIEKPFIEDIDNGNSEEVKVYGFKIDMINSNFSVNYLINREILYNILLNNKVNCRYEPCIHACVNIKYSIEIISIEYFIIISMKFSCHIIWTYV